MMKVFCVYLGALVFAILASCTRATPDPTKVHPAGTTTSGLQALRNPGASAGGSGAVGPAGSESLATAPMDGSTTSVAPATSDLGTGPASEAASDAASGTSRKH